MDFKEYYDKKMLESSQDDFKLFKDYKSEENKGFYFLTEQENSKVDEWVNVFESEHGNDLTKLDESFFKKMLGIKEDEELEEGFFGGVVGFLVGPTVGKIMANALGVEKGILYDMFTSKLVNVALGSAIQNHLKKK